MDNVPVSIFNSVFCMDEAVSQVKGWRGGCPSSHWARGRETNWTGNRSIAGDTPINLTLKSRLIFLI